MKLPVCLQSELIAADTQLLPCTAAAALQAVLASLQRHWERGSMRVPPEGAGQPALEAAARLLPHFVTSQLGRAEAGPQELLQAVVALLGQASGMMFARR